MDLFLEGVQAARIQEGKIFRDQDGMKVKRTTTTQEEPRTYSPNTKLTFKTPVRFCKPIQCIDSSLFTFSRRSYPEPRKAIQTRVTMEQVGVRASCVGMTPDQAADIGLANH